MSVAEHIPPGKVWASIDQQTRQEVVNTFRNIVKEMINEHFRFDSAAPSSASCGHLHSSVESESGRDKSGESANAVRAA